MAVADGSVIIDVLLNDDDVASGMDRINGSVGKLTGIAGKVVLGLAAVGTAAAVAFAGFSKQVIVAAASASAINAQFDQVFGSLGKQAQSSIDKMAGEFGMVSSRLKPSFTAMTSMFKGLGLDTEQAMTQAATATTLVADAAAFYDKSFEDANGSLNSFIKGNYEGGESIGLFANEKQLAKFAADELGLSWKTLDEAGKQIARLEYAKAMQEAAGATGQAARESDGLENLLGNLKAVWNDLMVEFGTPILPIVTEWLSKIAKAIADFDASPYINGFTLIWQALDKFASGIEGFISGIKSSMGEEGVLGALGINTGSVAVMTGYLYMVRDAFTDVFQGIQGIVSQVMPFIVEYILPVIMQIADIVMANLPMVLDIFTNVFNGVVAVVEYAFGFIKTYIMPIVSDIVSFVGDQLSVLREFWKTNGDQIVQAVTNAFNMVKSVIDFIMPAVLFVVDFVWTAIKQVISGALNVIMGLVKVFSGLFTGDFDKMWEGVKQMFFGAIDLIIGWLSLTFVGGIRTLLMNLGKSSISIVKSMWDDIIKFFKNFGDDAAAMVSKMATGVVNYFKGILTQAQSIFGTLRTFGSTVWNALKTTVVNVAKQMWDDVVRNFTGMVNGVKNIFTTIKTVISNIWNSVMTYFNGISLHSIGVNIMTGLINGIGSMASKIKEKVESMANALPEWMKKVLGIHSPSRVMMGVGMDTMDGLNNGLASRQKESLKIVGDLGTAVINKGKELKAEVVKLEKEMAAEIQKVQSESSKSQNKIVTDGKNTKKRNIASENTKIAEVETKGEEKIKEIKKKYAEEIKKIHDTTDAERLKSIQAFIDTKKKMEEISMVDEAKLWESGVKHFKDGTAEKLEAQVKYREAVTKVNAEVISINTEYSNKMMEINNKLRDDEKKVTDEYNNSVVERAKAIRGFAGLFDEVDDAVAGSSQKLTENLANQVYYLYQWKDEFAKLSKKAIDQGLIEELRQMGPKALPELLALNSMTDEELTVYSNLYKSKTAVARKQAETELVGMKNDTAKAITELRKTANTELTKLELEWKVKMGTITKTSSQELSHLKAVGKNAAQGLLTGLSSMEKSLYAKAKSIAEGIKSTMSKALQIHSPSRWMKNMIGRNMMLGWIEGMDAERLATIKKSQEAVDWMTPDLPDISSGFLSKLKGVDPLGNFNVSPTGTGVTGGVLGGSSKSSTFAPHFENHFTPAESTPAENIRKQRQLVQKLGMDYVTG